MARTRKEARCGVVKEAGRLYFVDKDGDVSSCEMTRGRKAGTGKKRRKK